MGEMADLRPRAGPTEGVETARLSAAAREARAASAFRETVSTPIPAFPREYVRAAEGRAWRRAVPTASSIASSFVSTCTRCSSIAAWAPAPSRRSRQPKGVPREVVARLVPVLKKAHASKEFQDFMRNQGYGVAWMDPAESVARMEQAYAEFGRLMKAAGLAK